MVQVGVILNFQPDIPTQLLMEEIRIFNEHERQQREYKSYVQEKH